MKLSESDDFSQTTTASMRFLEIPISRLRMEVVFSYFLGVSNLGNFEDKSHEGSSCQLSGIWILRLVSWSRVGERSKYQNGKYRQYTTIRTEV